MKRMLSVLLLASVLTFAVVPTASAAVSQTSWRIPIDPFGSYAYTWWDPETDEVGWYFYYPPRVAWAAKWGGNGLAALTSWAFKIATRNPMIPGQYYKDAWLNYADVYWLPDGALEVYMPTW